MNILVTGGAGYIGSHMVMDLLSRDHKVVVVDNLSTGHRSSVPESAKFVLGEVGDCLFMQKVLREEDIQAVFHFAASASVPESMGHPAKYYQNNVVVTKNLGDACIEMGVKKLIFSSTAAVYGEASNYFVTEASPLNPINPYGESKLACENYLQQLAKQYPSDFSCAILRYFNVAGASPTGELGQSTKDAHHLIKIACEHALGVRDHVQVFGTDYNTPDGSCVRDFIHVMDIVAAHNSALELLNSGLQGAEIFNCGYGKGYSVKEVLATFSEISPYPLQIVEGPRRAGDPEALVACSDKLKSLGWKPQYDDLKFICQSALNWEQTLQSATRPKYHNANGSEQNHYVQQQ